jgi:hypothetical protein
MIVLGMWMRAGIILTVLYFMYLFLSIIDIFLLKNLSRIKFMIIILPYMFMSWLFCLFVSIFIENMQWYFYFNSPSLFEILKVSFDQFNAGLNFDLGVWLVFVFLVIKIIPYLIILIIIKKRRI